MAKKKSEVTDEIINVTENEVIDAEKISVEEEVSDVEKFIRNKLKVLNTIDNPAKAQRLAKRIISNRKEN